MISPFGMYSASTPVIAMKPIGCLRFPECPRAGRAGRLVFFKGQKAVPWTRANRDVASQAREVCSDLTAYSATWSSGNRVHADECQSLPVQPRHVKRKRPATNVHGGRSRRPGFGEGDDVTGRAFYSTDPKKNCLAGFATIERVLLRRGKSTGAVLILPQLPVRHGTKN